MFEAQEQDSGHKDLINDVAYDFYGERRATCSSDQFVKVWDQGNNETWSLSSSWKAHDGLILKVKWANPEFGQVIATCSFDRTAAVWEEIVDESPDPEEQVSRHWVKRTSLVDSRTSVTDIEFGPSCQGLQLATCSADGVVRIYEAPDVMNLSTWTLQHEIQSKLRCSCLSWSPALTKAHPQVLAVGSDDNTVPPNGGKVSIFEFNEFTRKWIKSETLNNITEPVQDLAIAPNLGRQFHILAVATNNLEILNLIPMGDNSSRMSKMEVQPVGHFEDHICRVWKVSWNITGTVLASTGDDGCVRLFKMHSTNSWKPIAVFTAEGDENDSNQRNSSIDVSDQSQNARFFKLRTIAEPRNLSLH